MHEMRTHRCMKSFTREDVLVALIGVRAWGRRRRHDTTRHQALQAERRRWHRRRSAPAHSNSRYRWQPQLLPSAHAANETRRDFPRHGACFFPHQGRGREEHEMHTMNQRMSTIERDLAETAAMIREGQIAHVRAMEEMRTESRKA